jgi:hypothetical protein
MVGLMITFIVAGVIATAWGSGIINMHKKHPNYKGEDFLDLDLDENDKDSIL